MNKRTYIEEETRLIRFVLIIPGILSALGWIILGCLWGAIGVEALLLFGLLLFAAAVGGLRAGEDSRE